MFLLSLFVRKCAYLYTLCLFVLYRLTTHLISSSEDGILKVWNVQCNNLDKPDSVLSELNTIHGAHSGVINSIDVSVDNRLVATASRDKTVKVTNNSLYFPLHNGQVTESSFSC